MLLYISEKLTVHSFIFSTTGVTKVGSTISAPESSFGNTTKTEP